jgi:hypothetical protein
MADLRLQLADQQQAAQRAMQEAKTAHELAHGAQTRADEASQKLLSAQYSARVRQSLEEELTTAKRQCAAYREEASAAT